MKATATAGTPTGDAHVDVARSSAIMAVGTVLSRVLGFVRASLLAAAIGLGYASGDAFTVANTLPAIIYMLLSGSVLNAVLVPSITRALRQGDAEARAFVDRLVTLSIAVTAGITLLVVLLAPLLVRPYIAGEVGDAEVQLATAFAYWCLPQVIFYGLYGVWGQLLNARGSFAPYTWAPIVNNLVAITGLVVFVALFGFGVKPVEEWTGLSIAVLAGSATLGVAAQALLLVPFLVRCGYRWRPRWGLRGTGMGSVSAMAAWALASVLITQIGFTITSRVLTAAGHAADAQAGGIRSSLQIYSNAFLLFMLPHSILTVSLVTALFTRMSGAASRGEASAVRADVTLGLRLILLVSVPATAFMAAMGPSVTAVLFPGNAAPETRGTGLGAAAMMLGLAAFSGTYLLQRVFYAYQDARTPFLVQVPAVAATMAGAVAVGAYVPSGWAVVGIGVVMSAVHVLTFGLSTVLVRRRIGREGAGVRRVTGARSSTGARIAVAAAAAALGCWLSAALLRRALPAVVGEPFAVEVCALFGAMLVMAALYLVGLKALGVRELSAALALLRGRRMRPVSGRT